MLDLNLQIEILQAVHYYGVITLEDLITELEKYEEHTSKDKSKIKTNLFYLIEGGQLSIMANNQCKLSNALLKEMYPAAKNDNNTIFGNFLNERLLKIKP